jgi:hypothetical protein
MAGHQTAPILHKPVEDDFSMAVMRLFLEAKKAHGSIAPSTYYQFVDFI